MKPMHLFYGLFLTLLFAIVAVPVVAQSNAAKPLPETYVSDDENLTLRYPHGWSIQSDTPGQVVIATDESLFNLSAEAVPSGEAALGVLFLDSSTGLSDLVSGSDPISILNSLVKTLFEQGDTKATLGTPEALTFADHAAARVDGTLTGNTIFLMIVDQGDKNYLLYVGITSADEMPKFEPKLLAIAESVRYALPTSS
ncbi:MAG: hypothetical protein ABI690_26585 [Chloroflexota bacterium]